MTQLGNKKSGSIVTDIIYILLLIIMAAGLTEFFHRQAIRYHDKYISDLIVYAQDIGGTEKSRMIAWIYTRLNEVDSSYYALSAFTSLLVVATVVAGYFFLRFLLERYHCHFERWKIQFASFLILLSGPIYIPTIHEHFYSGTWPKYAWHSPTEIAMVLFAIISLHLFIKLFDGYMEHIDFGTWIGLTLAVFLSVWAKPNFMLAFTPVVIVVLLAELVRHREYGFLHRFGHVVAFGCTMIPAGLFVLFLNRIEYDESKYDGGIAVNIGYFLKDLDYPLIAIACSIAFPVFVFLFNWKKLKDIALAASLGVFVTGTAEYLILVEAGSRINHGNFGWCRQVGEFLFFAVAVAVFMANLKDRDFLKSLPVLKALYLIAAGLLLAAHVLSQLVYVYLLMKGYLYRM